MKPVHTILLLAMIAIAIAPKVMADELPPKEKFMQFLLMGQSNMAGRGLIEDEDKKTHPRVLMLDQENRWVPAKAPLHFDKPSIAGVGLGLDFAIAVAEANPEWTIGLIPCAVGGTPLAQWMPDGDLYRKALTRAREAQQAGTIRGILWHQGESDAATKELAESYAKRLSKMIPQLRKDLGTPNALFIAGQLGHFLPDQDSKGMPSHWRIINEQIQSLPKHVEKVAIVDSTGLKHKGDKIHFDSESLRDLGRRYAKAYLENRSE